VEALGRIIIRSPYGPAHPQCYSLHALTSVIITKYTCIYNYLLLYLVKYINLNTKNEFINFYIQVSRKYRNIHFIVN